LDAAHAAAHAAGDAALLDRLDRLRAWADRAAEPDCAAV
jgi:hypothetical protein